MPRSASGPTSAPSTITANYDGYDKHRTTIGDRVKTSVDTTLVAPVTVGDDAYTGAGSVITKDVPRRRAGDRARAAANIEGYAERRAGGAPMATTPEDASGADDEPRIRRRLGT